MNLSIFRRKRKVITTAESARSWFFGKKLTHDKRSRGKLLAGTLQKRFEMKAPEGQLRTVRMMSTGSRLQRSRMPRAKR